MILYALLVILCVLAVLIFIGFLIAGLYKKRKKMWITGLAGAVCFILLGVFTSYVYTKKMISYVGSEEFQKDVREKGENAGKTMGSTISGYADGLEQNLEEDVIEKLSGKGGRILGKGMVAIEKGLDETQAKTTIYPNESANNAGIKLGNVESLPNKDVRTYGLYIEFSKDYKGKLYLTAFDKDGHKKDRAEIDVDEKAGQEKVFEFSFPYFEIGINDLCVLSTE